MKNNFYVAANQVLWLRLYPHWIYMYSMSGRSVAAEFRAVGFIRTSWRPACCPAVRHEEKTTNLDPRRRHGASAGHGQPRPGLGSWCHGAMVPWCVEDPPWRTAHRSSIQPWGEELFYLEKMQPQGTQRCSRTIPERALLYVRTEDDLSSGAGTAGFRGESSLFAINIPIHPCFCCKIPYLYICWYDCRLCLSTLHSSLLNPHFFATRPILCGSMMKSSLLVGEMSKLNFELGKIAVFFGWIPLTP